MESIENIANVSKEMAEIFFKDTDRQIDKETITIRDRLKDMFRFMKKGKDDRPEEKGEHT
eukprot:14875792-Heterocapsa_arctica.AAC.1